MNNLAGTDASVLTRNVVPPLDADGALLDLPAYRSTPTNRFAIVPSVQRVLVCSDDRAFAKALHENMSEHAYEVNCVKRVYDLPEMFYTRRPNLVIVYLRDADEAAHALTTVRAKCARTPVFQIAAGPETCTWTSDEQNGVVSFYGLPTIDTLLKHVHQFLRPGDTLPAGLPAGTAWRQGIVTRNAQMEALLTQAKQIAASDASVLIHGETGTGKELLARAIHLASARADQPFVAINCAAIPEALLESELFGHCKGAFTGALRDNKGLFQTAHKGTLFLDEIGEMSLAFQVKLLRTLQEKVIRPVGTSNAIPVDVRIISATNIDLQQAIRNGSYRGDLYYRLNVVTFELPPLSNRREDIPLLANHFLTQVISREGRKSKKFSPGALERLATAPWPGNIRQLCNVVEQLAVLAPTATISEQQVLRALNLEDTQIPELGAAKHEFEHEYLVRVMRIVAGNVSRAARLAGRNRTEFYKLLDKHGLRPTMFKEASLSAG